MKIRSAIGLFIILFLTSCSMETKPLQSVEKVDLQRYMGKWYDIAHFPATFLSGCDNITAEYSLTDKNYVRVLNRCIKKRNGKEKTIRGKAFKVKDSNNAKLKVQFFWPFKSDYWILELDDDYQYAAIGGPSRSYAWILARKPDPNETIVSMLLDSLSEHGFEVKLMERTQHTMPE